ncbi:MAG: pitrilysin family protein [Planctomycetia bacterium]|nr:pitrilysin family protein [Planctomycetia bacterium]
MRHARMSNGLEIITETMPSMRSCALGFFVRCGARHETPERAGVSHFLEHMVFKGTPTRTAQDVNRELDAMGISFNACTTEESTTYYASLLPEYLEPCLDVFTDILRPSLREADFRSEKEVVLEEIGMYEDTPPFCVDEKIRSAFFPNQPLGNSVLGNRESVSSLTVEQMKQYFHERYTWSNMVLCVCGCFDEKQLFDRRWPGRLEPVPKVVPMAKPLQTWTPEIHCMTHPLATQQYVLQCSRAPAAYSEERFAARLLASILGDDPGSRMYWELVDSGRAECASMGYIEYSDAGIFVVNLSCEPEEWEKNWQSVERLFQNVESGDITEKELSLAKNRLATATVLGNECPSGRLFGAGYEWLHHQKHFSVAEEVERFRAVTLDDLAELLKKYPPSQGLIYSVGP